MKERRSGLLDVKLPMSSRLSRLHKAWNRRRVDVELDAIASVDKVSLFLLVTVSEKPKEKEKSSQKKKPLWQNWFSPSTAVLFRCRSRTQKYSFTLCENGVPVLHLAGESEAEIQEWIGTIRNMLWPPSPFLELQKTLGSVFEVSIIDNEYTHRAGLLGMYGHMTISSKKVALSHPQTGDIIQEWYLDTVSFKLLPQAKECDVDKVITMISDSNSSTGYGNIVMFCENSKELIERVHEVRKIFAEPKSYGEEVTKTLQDTFAISNERPLAESFEHYQIPRNDGKRIEMFDPPMFHFNRPISDSFLVSGTGNGYRRGSCSIGALPDDGSTDTFFRRGGENRLFGWKNIQNIPASMLDCSISSGVFSRSFSEVCSEDRYSSVDSAAREDSFDSLLEEAAIYEEIADLVEAEELPPPLPPKRCSTQLQKFDETDSSNVRNSSSSGIPNARSRRRNTIDVGTIQRTKDERIVQLTRTIDALRFDHEDVVGYIRSLLTGVSELYAKPIKPGDMQKQRSYSDYCTMRALRLENNGSRECDYVDMRSFLNP